MTATTYFEIRHGSSTEFLSKQACINTMQEFADHAILELKKEKFKSEEINYNVEEKRNKNIER